MQEKTETKEWGFIPSMLVGMGIGLAGCIMLALAVVLWRVLLT